MAFHKIDNENILRNVVKTHPLVKISIYKGKSVCNMKNTEDIEFASVVQTIVGPFIEHLPSLEFDSYYNSMYLPII
jgi:hypothetical protein